MPFPMNVSPPSISAPPVPPNPWNAFGGVWRLSFRRWSSPRQLLACAGLFAALAGIATSTNPPGDAVAYFEWFGGVFLGAAVPILSFLSGAGAVRDDLKPGAVDYLFTRPVRRPVFLAARYVSHLACAQLTCLGAFGVLAAVGVYRGIPGLAAGLPLLLLAQTITVAGFVALGFFCAMAASRYLIAGLLYGGLVEAGAGLIPTQLSRLSMTRQVRDLLAPLVAPTPGAEGAGALATTLHLLVFAVVFVAAAAAIFSRKELAGEAARE